MLNFKISNGKITQENLSNKLDNFKVLETLRTGDQNYDTQQQVINSNSFPKFTIQKSGTKDILEEAMSAMVCDMTDNDISILPMDMNPISPNTVKESDFCEELRKTVEAVTNSLPSSPRSQNILPFQITSRNEVDNFSLGNPNSFPSNKNFDDDKIDPFKPDLSIIPILKSSSTEKSSSSVPILRSPPKLNLLCTETFVDHLDSPQSSMEDDTISTTSTPRNVDLVSATSEISEKYSIPEAEKEPSTAKNKKEDIDMEEDEFKDSPLKDLLTWDNESGVLPGSNLKFKMNEFDALELVEDEILDQVKGDLKENATSDKVSSEVVVKKESSPVPPSEIKSTSTSSGPVHVHHSRKTNHYIKKEDEDSNSLDVNNDDDDIRCCKNCGCYGLSSEFIDRKEQKSFFCTMSCAEEYEIKEVGWNKEKLRVEKIRSRSSRKQKLVEREEQPDVVVEVPPLKSGAQTWSDGKLDFYWPKYLEYCGKSKGLTRSAPQKFWQEPFPFGKNLFKMGYKLEAIDPQHQALFCVMTVVDVIGHRIRLHIDGYSDLHDFWCNSNSTNLFQAGWCEKNGRKLETPLGVVNFTWKAYLEHCKATAAPRSTFFTKHFSNITPPSNFRVGMKLEAEDRKNGWTCVATVADFLDSRILVHFDGWDKAFDTWFDVNSPFLHPVGWCAENGVYLFPPKDDPDPDSFNWQEYIQDNNAVGVPARAFKPRASKDFKVGMKLEAGDKRNPTLIRVATVVDVKDYKIQLYFDGWSEDYNLWVDDDSSDIHPATWCLKTGHPLQPPLTPEQCAEDVDSGMGCGTPGCKGIGHVKGLIYTNHHTAYGCPYSLQNLDKDLEAALPDRLELPIEKKKSKTPKLVVNLDPTKPIPVDSDDENQPKRVRKRRKFFDEIVVPECQKNAKIPRTLSDDIRFLSIGKNGNHDFMRSASDEFLLDKKPVMNKETKIDSIVHQSVFNPIYDPKPILPPPLVLEKHKHLTALKEINKSDVSKWSYRDVKQFISSVCGCSVTAKKFVDHQIDGVSFLMVTQQDLIEVLGIKLGPSIKIISSLVTLKNL